MKTLYTLFMQIRGLPANMFGMLPDKISELFCAAACLLMLPACNLVPAYKQPNVETPAIWRDSKLAAQKTAVQPEWWRTFGSTELDHLIKAALINNNDIGAAKERVEQARAQAKIAGAPLWPSAGLQGNLTDTRNDQSHLQTKSGQLTVSYVVDLWGANRAGRDAGSALLLSTEFAKDALQLLVMSSVSQAYFNLLAVDELRRIASEYNENTRQVLAIIESRFQRGAVSELDVVQQQTLVATARANLDLLNQQYVLAENSLSILLGHPPQQPISKQEHFLDINLPQVNGLQPASLLERRPDIRQVEMQLVAANANIGIARAAFYPKLQLNFTDLLATPQPAGAALTMAAALAQPLFQGGQLEGGLENAKARNAELVQIYRQTVLTAFKEVEDAAAIGNHSSRRLQALEIAVKNAQQAYQLSMNRYRIGAIDFQTLLNTQRSLLTAKNSLIQARLDLVTGLVQLYQAMGGGWKTGG